MKTSIEAIAVKAKQASSALALMSTQEKNKALNAMADAVVKNARAILAANAKDLSAARARKLPAPVIGRLTLDLPKLTKIAESIRQIAKLEDPVGRVLSKTGRPNGLFIKKVSVPLGAILIIYESRPNVTADCMALCLKSGNSVVLKGGSEALHSNRALYEALSRAAYRNGVPAGSMAFVDTTDRTAVKKLLTMTGVIDLVIPRGGEGLIREVARLSTIPVIKHYKGVCHVYLDRSADPARAKAIVVNAKAQNPSACNAMETLLVNEAFAKDHLSDIADALKVSGVELRGDSKTRALIPGVKAATEKDWETEYLDLILSIKIVKDVAEAVQHIETHGSHHSDAIVTEDREAAKYFTSHVDSSAVFVNASTRFNDGGEFGMGAEMGISTDKLHVRGPMGLAELTSYKYVVMGDGQTRG